jgi:hypothetical protein
MIILGIGVRYNIRWVWAHTESVRRKATDRAWAGDGTVRADGDIATRPRDMTARYPYNPRREIVAMCWASVAALTVAVFVMGLYGARGLGIVEVILGFFGGFGVVVTLRRHAFPRDLVLDDEGIWLPSGFLRLQVRRVVFAEVTDVWEVFLPRTAVLCLRHRGKSYEITSTCLADHETYLNVAGSIISRMADTDV